MSYAIKGRAKWKNPDDFPVGYYSDRQIATSEARSMQRWASNSEYYVCHHYPDFKKASKTCLMSFPMKVSDYRKPDVEIADFMWDLHKPPVPPWMHRARIYERFGLEPNLHDTLGFPQTPDG